ncbi:MAG: hypothetical protein PHU76_01815 [Synergistaceae bacterium]|nr:hypothetical protein [Proteiniphilum sp.]MDD3963177.1 hypothetical protein [Synergistaceae bacterium]
MKNKVKPPIDIDCRNCSECGKSGCTLDRCGYAVELNDHFYRSYIEEAFSPLHSPYFRQRLTNYLKNPRLRIFRNEEHLNRWENAVEELQPKTAKEFGVLLLVSSYPEIWEAVHTDRQDSQLQFESEPPFNLPRKLESVYQAAKAFASDSKISLNDLADSFFVCDEEFFVIITGYMLARYGKRLFNETPILF